MTFEAYISGLAQAKTEETVKAVYAKYYNIKYDTANRHDLYTPEVLFEFKYDKNFENLKALATILAQSLYYIRRLKYEDIDKVIPPYISLADKNEATITYTSSWKTYYTNDAYDWKRAPSKPDPMLVDHLVKEPETAKLHIYKITKKAEHNAFSKKLKNCLHPQMEFEFGDKKVINEENFEAVFEHWKDIIGKQIINGYKMSFYFLSNLQPERVIVDKESNRVVFNFEDNNSKTQKIMMKDYQYFWDLYDQVDSIDVIKGIHAKLDRLTDESQRRFEGEFYTPLRFAKKAIHYINDVLGKNWYKKGKYRIWDMAAGSGNLEWHLPAEAYKYLYMSTLHTSETDHNKKVFPEATCFQYDYLNDDIDYLFTKDWLPFEPQWKLPEKLRNELKDKSLTWIVFINPPFATAQVGGAKGENKEGVSKTKIEIQMTNEKIGHAKRELFAQFMYRVCYEMPNNTYLGMFSKLKYLNAPDSVDFRDKYFNYKFEKGFIFKSTTFQGVKGKYPIGFLIWNLNERRFEEKKVSLDICDDQGIAIGVKNISLISRDDVINKWFERPANSDEFILPPLSNGVTVKNSNLDIRHRARPDFLASICSKGNDFQNSMYVTILSSPSVSAGAFTVNHEIFEKSLILHAVRKIPKPTWLNDRNQFLKPRIEPDTEFAIDCIIWSLFSSSNETTALKNVQYQDQEFQIKNNFFPFTIETIKNWKIKDADFKLQIGNDEDRFVATWLKGKQLSIEAKDVFEKGEEVYKEFYANLHNMTTHKLKIDSWDAGWYQIRRCMADHNIGNDVIIELKELNQKLANKILPKIYKYGFLDKDEVYEEI
ncbi:MAG: hypothetical protein HQ554_01495 [FCB group bacterium]|nr:hypothetical protein [FCB group bacterium]